MAPRRLLAASVALAALALPACGFGAGDADRGDIVDAMRDVDMTDEQADCVADAMVERFEQSDLNEIAGAADRDEFPEGTQDEIDIILTACVEEGRQPTEEDFSGDEGGEGSDTTATTEGSGTTGTTGTTEASGATATTGSTATTAAGAPTTTAPPR